MDLVAQHWPALLVAAISAWLLVETKALYRWLIDAAIHVAVRTMPISRREQSKEEWAG